MNPLVLGLVMSLRWVVYAFVKALGVSVVVSSLCHYSVAVFSGRLRSSVVVCVFASHMRLVVIVLGHHQWAMI